MIMLNSANAFNTDLFL